MAEAAAKKAASERVVEKAISEKAGVETVAAEKGSDKNATAKDAAAVKPLKKIVPQIIVSDTSAITITDVCKSCCCGAYCC